MPESDPLDWWRKWRSCSSKHVYALETHAEEAIVKNEHRFHRRFRKYHCKFCKQYHLTTQSLRANAARWEQQRDVNQ